MFQWELKVLFKRIYFFLVQICCRYVSNQAKLWVEKACRYCEVLAILSLGQPKAGSTQRTLVTNGLYFFNNVPDKVVLEKSHSQQHCTSWIGSLEFLHTVSCPNIILLHRRGEVEKKQIIQCRV